MADRALMDGYQRGCNFYNEKAASMKPYMDKVDESSEKTLVNYRQKTTDALSGMKDAGKNGWNKWKNWMNESPSKNGAITMAAITGPLYGAVAHVLEGSPFYEKLSSPVMDNPIVTQYLHQVPEPLIVGSVAALAAAAVYVSANGVLDLGTIWKKCHEENKARKFSKKE
jgi:hypothetical protein